MNESQIRAYWQQRDEDQPRIHLAQVRETAEVFHKRARMGDLIEYIACAVVVTASCFYALAFPGLRMKLASLTMAAATLFVAYQLRRNASRTLPPDSTAVPLLEFHRRELTRRMALLRDSWRLFVAPLMAAMLVFLACLAPDRPEAGLPLLVFAGAVASMGAAISLCNRWQARRLQRQIDQLDAFDPTADVAT
jgi:hypothetical protein